MYVHGSLNPLRNPLKLALISQIAKDISEIQSSNVHVHGAPVPSEMLANHLQIASWPLLVV